MDRRLLPRSSTNAAEVAHASGVSIGKAKATAETGQALGDAPEVCDAFKIGDISADQATEIRPGRTRSAGSATELLDVAHKETFQVLRERARKVVLEAEQHRGLAERQHAARRARSHTDELGMVHVHLALEPHVRTPIVNRAEAEAARLYRAAKKEDRLEPFARFLADAYAGMLAGAAANRARRPELVVLVSHKVARRGWKDVRSGEMCKIPGLGPVAPDAAKQIAQDAFLTGVLFDGKDLRQMRRWTHNVPVEVFTALELGGPPEFDGVKCVECGKRFRPEKDHLEPHSAFGPASTDNLEWRCHACHSAKTERDRKAGKLGPRTSRPGAARGKPRPGEGLRGPRRSADRPLNEPVAERAAQHRRRRRARD